jgi:hypothetical protein
MELLISGFHPPLKRPRERLNCPGRAAIERERECLMAPRIVVAAPSIAFGIAVVGATVRTVRQLKLQAWHAADGQSLAATRTNQKS